ncbi:MAG: hypothetical protein NUV93_01095, partial [Firmicutes bacterium]|nr:hypothetical protein [Bacillota bacterium]
LQDVSGKAVEGERDKQRAGLVSEIERLDAALRRQQIAYESGATTLEEYALRMTELRRERQAKEDLLFSISRKLPSTEDFAERVEAVYRKVQEKLTGIHELPLESKMQLLRAAFESVYLDREYVISGFTFRL